MLPLSGSTFHLGKYGGKAELDFLASVNFVRIPSQILFRFPIEISRFPERNTQTLATGTNKAFRQVDDLNDVIGVVG